MSDDDLDQTVVHLIHRAYQRAEEAFQSEAAGHLTPRQYVLLTSIAHTEGASQTDLAGVTGIDRSTTAAMVRRLARKGLVHRRRARYDTRAYIIKLTDKGRRALTAAEPFARQVDEKVLAVLPAQDRLRFLNSLLQIVGAHETRRPH
jgi:DNA-binding MarR family transcriptional regulator